MSTPTEVLFLVEDEPDGGYNGRAIGHAIFTHGDDWDDLQDMVRDAVLCHFEDGQAPRLIRLHYVREEVLAV